jgi:uncharacterized protein YkwD
MSKTTAFARPLTRTVAAAATAAALLIAVPAAAHADSASDSCAGADVVPTSATAPAAVSTTLCLVNAERAEHGLKPVTLDGKLTRAARHMSTDMIRRNFLSHVTPTGGTLTTRLAKVDYQSATQDWSAGEIIGAGTGGLSTPAELMATWLDSPPHRAALLDRTFTHFGAGVAVGAPAADGTSRAAYTVEFGTIS